MSKVRVLTPVVALKDPTEDVKTLNLEGLAASKIRVGFLDNTKPNAGRLFAYVGDLLTECGSAASTFVMDKADSPGNQSGTSATEAVFKQLSQKADIVLTGLGN